ncbi:MAG: adenylyltransferase/cytidyltransferase family protein [Magnetococcales bacterium]|nr:adenylyltransferase/cytidyltransferase family protein [Magnetococcales bacterium]
MIIPFAALRDLRGKVTLVGGGFDPIHQGHIAYFQAAAQFGLPVLCSVDGDAYVARKHKPLLAIHNRIQVLDAIRYLQYTYQNPGSTAEVLEALRPALYVKGADWSGRLPADEVALCRAHDIEIRFVSTVLDSSSRLLQAFLQERGS